jgi:hypothetical protein
MRTMLLCAALAASGCASTGRSTPERGTLLDAAAEAAEDCSAVCGGNPVEPEGGCQAGCPGDWDEQCGGTWYQCCDECYAPLPDGALYP